MNTTPNKSHSGPQRLSPISNTKKKEVRTSAPTVQATPNGLNESRKITLSPISHTPFPSHDLTRLQTSPKRHDQLPPLNTHQDEGPPQQSRIELSPSKVNSHIPDTEHIDCSKSYTLDFEASVSIGTSIPGMGVNITRNQSAPLKSLSPSQIYTQLNHLMSVGDKLGSGSFGEVREVTLINTPLATTMLAAAKFFSDYSEKGIASIQHEFETLKSLQGKPGIIQLVNVDMTINDTLVGYAMERGEGTLQTTLAKSVFSIADTCKLAKDLIAGGCSLAESNLVHRDGKPGNVVKIPDGLGSFNWKKIDFGLVSTEGSPIEDKGTILYRSPESYGGATTTKGYKTSSKQDVFADGLILAETLLKQLPQDPDAPKTIIHAKNKAPSTEDSDYHIPKECPPMTVSLRVFSEYTPLFYTPAVEKLTEVKRQFPESAALTDLAIRMIDANPEQRPSFSECQRILNAAYPD